MSNGLDLDQDRQSVGPDLYVDCLKMVGELMTHAHFRLIRKCHGHKSETKPGAP